MKKYWSLLFCILCLLSFSNPAGAYTPLRSEDTLIVVSTESDILNPTDGECSLREAVIAANTNTASGAVPGECPAGSGTDDIILPVGVFRITISGPGENLAATGDLDILESVNIYGLGGQFSTIDSDIADRIFHIFNPVTLKLYDLTIKEGTVNTEYGGGAGVFAELGRLEARNIIFRGNFVGGTQSSNIGGAILARGELEVIDCLFYNNYASRGGAIFLSGDVANAEIKRSLFLKNNSSSGTISSYGEVSIQNSTFSQNNAQNSGGGAIFNAGSMSISFCTFSENSNSGPMSVVHTGAVYNSTDGTISVNQSILANNHATNPDTKNCNSIGAWVTSSFNLEDDDSCPLGTNNLYNSNPRLGPLADWGGPTETYPLLFGSPAIDSAGNTNCPPNDQRGVLRPIDGNNNSIATCDIGAFESEKDYRQVYLPLAVK